MRSILAICVLFFSVCAVQGQEDAGEPNAQQQQINREMIEALLQIVSPGCRNEMESAIQSQTEVSSDCKFEIQQAVRRISGQPEDNGQADGTDSAASQAEAIQKGGVHPGFWIAMFVLALFGGVAAYAMYVNRLLSEVYPDKKPKKLSKKKLEKERMKQK